MRSRLPWQGRGGRKVPASADGQPAPGAAARVPAAADAAQAPVFRLRGTGGIRAAAGQFPGGISPLPVAATSGGPPRPRRLLYPDGTRLACRPQGSSRGRWTGVACGVVPGGDGGQAGWLQVVRRDKAADPAALVTVHPALLSPERVDPYAGMNRRQRRRFQAFDAAEGAGRGSARLPARLVDEGDFIAGDGAAGILQVSQAVLACGAAGPSVRLLADDLAGGTDMRVCRESDLVDVLLPARHPAEDGPQARHLFAPGPPAPPVRPARPALRWDGSR